jgi:hypothetical protein
MAVGRSGVTWLSNPLFGVLVSWRNVGLLVAKSVLRELLFPLAWYHSIDFGMQHRLDVWPFLECGYRGWTSSRVDHATSPS